MRLIDADALKKEMLETYEHEYPTASGAFDEFASRIVPNIISNAPTIDAEPVRHGRWLKNVLFYGTHTCSNCGKDPNHFECATGYVEILSDYCPNCGAKMDEVSE